MAHMVLDFPEDTWPAPLMSWNQRLHHHVRSERTRAWRTLTAEAARAQGWKAGQSVRIVLEVTFPSNHRRDSGNLQRTAKAMVDGLVDADVIPDDCDGIVVGPDMRRVYPNGKRHLRLIIEEIGPEAFTTRRTI